MKSGKLLVANRGEIAVRILRTAAELGWQTVAVHPEDDANSLHTRKADEVCVLPGRGVAAYLDQVAVLAAASEIGATAIHPGYGFLSENAVFAERCRQAGIHFVGPTAETLALFGDKHAARALAIQNDVPVIAGTSAPTTLDEVKAFLSSLGENGAIMIKAVAGGGGRGMRPVHALDQLEEAYERCASEAQASFGNGDVFVEGLVRRARHIEVQIIGDGTDVSHLWERDCSLQRRRQKIVEIEPAPNVSAELRDRLIASALRLARAANYLSLGTIEFLVDIDTGEHFFIEANPRLQVEHTITEEVTGYDLVALQLQLLEGNSLSDLKLLPEQVRRPEGMALQVRINAETMTSSGDVRPSGGTLAAYTPPSGRGIRVDGYGYTGYRSSPFYDSLLAKLIVFDRCATLPTILIKAYRALCEFHIDGVSTNVSFLKALLGHGAVRDGATDTNFVEDHASELVADADADQRHLYFANTMAGIPEAGPPQAGARVDTSDPLSVLAHGQSQGVTAARPAQINDDDLLEGVIAVRAPLQGTVISVDVSDGQQVNLGTQLAVMEAMKMEHVIAAPEPGIIANLNVSEGDTIWEGHVLMVLDPSASGSEQVSQEEDVDLDHIRADLAELFERRNLTRDENRPVAVARRRKTNQRTARENVADLFDPDTFVEYGPLVVAAQRRRRSIEDLLKRSPADGMIAGVGQINRHLFDDPHNRAAVMAYDYTVFAGTQGVHNHWKTDRILDVAERGRMPLVVFAEGGGGRPGESDYGGFVGQNTFQHFGQLSGLVPLVGIVSGRCFAGNAALLGCCDVIIATANANIGMGGPAMIEGGGLGVFKPEEVGSMADQVPNGVVDISVADEAEAAAIAKKYLAYFQGRTAEWQAPDQRRMRAIVPENRLRVYEIRDVINTLADVGSVLELRRGFGKTMVTCFIRVEGRPVGVIANDPRYLGGAIDSDGADKGSRFMQLCDAFDMPVLNLCDTPGIMVGPEVEKTALVRHAARMFLVGNNLTTPFFTVVLRKAYGLGAIAMAGGNFNAPYYTVSWPTGEFGPMGLEGQVKLGYRAELAAIEDTDKRRQYFEEMVAQSYQEGKALERSTTFPIDDTIDPAETRFWLVNLLASIRPPAQRDGKKRPMIDAW